MQVLSTQIGFVLCFKSLHDLETVISNLKGLVEHIKANSVPGPHLYMHSSDHVPEKEVVEFLESMKPIQEVAAVKGKKFFECPVCFYRMNYSPYRSTPHCYHSVNPTSKPAYMHVVVVPDMTEQGGRSEKG